MTRRQALERVGFLRNVSPGVRERIADLGAERTYPRGAILCMEHEPCPGLMVVLTGSVRVMKLDTRGREMTLSVERPGGSILDLPLFDGGNCPAHAIANEDDTVVLVVPRERFVALLKTNPEISAAAIRHLSIQMRKLIEMLKVQALHTVRSRLAAYLLQADNGEREFPLRETNEAIGSHVGTVREVISRTLSAFETEGIIRKTGRRIRILDPESLRRIASGAA